MKQRPFTSPTSTAMRRPARDGARRLRRIERNAQVLGEMVERAERQDAERRAAAAHHVGHRADRAVAARGHQHRRTLPQRTPRELPDLLAARESVDSRFKTRLAESGAERLGIGRAPAAGVPVEDDRNFVRGDGRVREGVQADDPSQDTCPGAG